LLFSGGITKVRGHAGDNAGVRPSSPFCPYATTPAKRLPCLDVA
jgi:hypothetical protein